MTITADSLGMVEPMQLATPLQLVWHTKGPLGRTQTSLTMDAPLLEGDYIAQARYARLVWSATVATATSVDTELTGVSLVRWKEGPVTFGPYAAGDIGRLVEASGERASCGELVLWSGGPNSHRSKRLLVPGLPLGRAPNGVLNTAGMRLLERLGHTFVGGAFGLETGAPQQLYNAFPGVLTPHPGNPGGVGLRRVEFVVVCSYTGQAPGEGRGW